MSTMAMLFSEMPYRNTWKMDAVMLTAVNRISDRAMLRLRRRKYCKTTDNWIRITASGMA